MTLRHPLVELSITALGHLGQVPRYGDACRGRAAELERAWVRAPLSVAIGGALPARTELFNTLCGKKVLDPENRPIGCASLRIRRGAETRFKATRDDGSTEEHVLPPEQVDDDVLRLRTVAAQGVVDERKLALERFENVLPRFARTRPSGLRIWLWPIWWLMTRRHRRALAERRFSEIAYDQSFDALALAQSEHATSEARIRVERGRFFESLRALSSGPPLGTHVREVELVLANGPLPEGLELVELTRPQASEAVDAVLLVERDAFHAPHTKEGDAPKLGTIADMLPMLPALLGRARALGIARRARAEIDRPLTELDNEISDTEEGFRLRIERLEAMQILDAEEFARAELAKVRPQITQSVHAVIEHAAAHLAGELERLGAEWTAVIGQSANNDGLKYAVGRIESSAPIDAKRIADEVRSLAIGGAAGSAHDVFPELLAALRPLGLEEAPPKSAPMLPLLEMLPSLSNASPSKLTGAAGWVTGLFRSFETRRGEVADKAFARITHVRAVAAAEILDAEPKLRAAIEQTLHAELRAAIERQVAWLDRALATEREAVARDGSALAPLARMRDRLLHDFKRLVETLQHVESESPALAAAVPAVTSGA